eukprot:scaffold285307_cov18-Tisochrysis_lutea.AAC.1
MGPQWTPALPLHHQPHCHLNQEHLPRERAQCTPGPPAAAPPASAAAPAPHQSRRPPPPPPHGTLHGDHGGAFQSPRDQLWVRAPSSPARCRRRWQLGPGDRRQRLGGERKPRVTAAAAAAA